jgi:putative ABC transport system permease protein
LGGGAAGVALGVAGSSALARLVPDSVRLVQDVRVDLTVLLFAAGVTLASVIGFGLLPAIGVVRGNFMGALRSGARETGRGANRLRGTLVVAQLSLAVVLLVGAGLLLRSFLLMQRVDLGFRADGVLVTSVAFPATRYPGSPPVLAGTDALLARLRASPAVLRAEFTDVAPFTAGDQDISVRPVGEPTGDDLPTVWYRSVSPGYLGGMRMRLVSGRHIAQSDGAGADRVGIVNEEAARRLFPGQDAVGRVLAAGSSPDATRITIIGVVASGRHDGPTEPYKSELYLSYAQFPTRRVTVAIEPARDSASAVEALRDALRGIDPLVPIGRVQTLRSLAGDAVSLPRMYAMLVGGFAAAAVFLAAIGVYGVMAYSVSRREREIGVRLALGAAPAAIRWMILGEGGRLAALGVVLGLGAAVAFGQLLGAMLFGVTALDAPTLFAAVVVLALMTVFAAWLPARRAMRVDPLSAMRAE